MLGHITHEVPSGALCERLALFVCTNFVEIYIAPVSLIEDLGGLRGVACCDRSDTGCERDTADSCGLASPKDGEGTLDSRTDKLVLITWLLNSVRGGDMKHIS